MTVEGVDWRMKAFSNKSKSQFILYFSVHSVQERQVLYMSRSQRTECTFGYHSDANDCNPVCYDVAKFWRCATPRSHPTLMHSRTGGNCAIPLMPRTQHILLKVKMTFKGAVHSKRPKNTFFTLPGVLAIHPNSSV